MKNVVVLGSTGSIGRQVLDVVQSQPDDFRIIGLAAGNNARLLAHQVSIFKPGTVCLINNIELFASSTPVSVLQGMDGLVSMAASPEADLVVLATPGISGLRPLVEAIISGKSVALANKEALFVAGELIMRLARSRQSIIYPVDSEPSAIWQCLAGESAKAPDGADWIHDASATTNVRHIVLTASGGPFRQLDPAQLKQVTPDLALKHPIWPMGVKTTIDSATMLNKGMEVAETHWLFGVDWNKIGAVIHPQGVIHSLVEFVDGTFKAVLSQPNMRLPIQYALNGMRRNMSVVERLDLERIFQLTFEPIDPLKFRCFVLATEAGRLGGTYPAVVNAADEILVPLFLDRRIGFDRIANVIEEVLSRHQSESIVGVQQIEAVDEWSRQLTIKLAQQEA